ncbi:MAG: hypothetical protein LBR94_05875 [Desulfovibrio sp.]|jgi:hypothetical protein|nr:hypothetical protein [Desulfovibrio sp.]
MTIINNTPDNRYPEHEKMKKASNIALRLNNFFVWLVRENVIQSKYFVYDTFPPNGETGDQIILRYLGISAEKLDAEKRAMAVNFQKMAEFAQNMEQQSVPAESAPSPSDSADADDERDSDEQEKGSNKGTFYVRPDTKDI